MSEITAEILTKVFHPVSAHHPENLFAIIELFGQKPKPNLPLLRSGIVRGADFGDLFTMLVPDHPLSLRVTIIAGERLTDNFQVYWDHLPIGCILQQPSVHTASRTGRGA